LPTAEQPLRVVEFDTLFATSLRGLERVSETRLRLTLDAAAEGTARDLTRRENECCSFFSFDFAPAGGDMVALEIRVPAPYIGVLDAIADRAGSPA
jgi:hypothetical protein